MNLFFKSENEKNLFFKSENPKIILVKTITTKNIISNIWFFDRINNEIYNGNVMYNMKFDFPESLDKNLWLYFEINLINSKTRIKLQINPTR